MVLWYVNYEDLIKSRPSLADYEITGFSYAPYRHREMAGYLQLIVHFTKNGKTRRIRVGISTDRECEAVMNRLHKFCYEA